MKKVIFVFLFVLLTSNSFALGNQLQKITDKELNSYFFDNFLKKNVTENPKYQFVPANYNNLDFYLIQAQALLKRHYYPEGITMLKAILALPPEKGISFYQKEATKELQNLKKNQGFRYKVLAEQTSLILYQKEDVYFVLNDYFGYHFKTKFNLEIKKSEFKREKNSKEHHFLSFLSSQKGQKKADFILAIDCQQFKYKIKKLSDYQKMLSSVISTDQFNRKIISKNKQQIIYEFSDNQYFGYEIYLFQENQGLIARSIAPIQKKASIQNEMLNTIKEIKF